MLCSGSALHNRHNCQLGKLSVWAYFHSADGRDSVESLGDVLKQAANSAHSHKFAVLVICVTFCFPGGMENGQFAAGVVKPVSISTKE